MRPEKRIGSIAAHRFSSVMCMLTLTAALVFAAMASGCLPKSKAGLSIPGPAPLGAKTATPGPNRVTSITARLSGEAVFLRLEANRPLIYSSVRRPKDATLSLYFPETTLFRHGVVSLPKNSIVKEILGRAASEDGGPAVIDVRLEPDVECAFQQEASGLLVRFTRPLPMNRPGPAALPPVKEKGPVAEKDQPEGRRLIAVSAENLRERAVVSLESDAPITDYNFFSVEYPPRTVFDFFSLRGPIPGSAIVPESQDWYRRIDWEPYPDRVRMTIETVPAKRVEVTARTVDRGLLITLVPAASVEQKSEKVVPVPDDAVSPSLQPPSSPLADALSAGQARISSVVVQSRTSGKIVLTVHTNGRINYRVEPVGANRLMLIFPDTEMPVSLQKFNFSAGAVEIAAQPSTERAVFSILRSRRLPYYVEREARAVAVHLPAPLQADGQRPKKTADGKGSKGEAAPADPEKEEILRFLDSWRDAWEKTAGKDGSIDEYMAHYAESFGAGGLDKDGWRLDKQAKNASRQWISGRLMEIRISDADQQGRRQVFFLLEYSADNYAEVLEKNMTLLKEGGAWKIRSESTRLVPKPSGHRSGTFPP